MPSTVPAIAGGCTARKTMSCREAAKLSLVVLIAGNRVLSWASVSAFVSLTVITAGSFPARLHPSRKTRVMRPPPMNPIVFVDHSYSIFLVLI